MSGSGKKNKLPPPPPPTPTPEQVDLQSLEKGEAERRKLLSRKGRRSTILTEGNLGTADTTKATLLGSTGV